MYVPDRQMNPHLKKLYPDAKKIFWTYNVIRGGDKFGDQPRAVGGPHLDYHQNDTLRKEFHKERPVFTYRVSGMETSEPDILMGLHDTEDLKLGVLLGVWKPLHPSKVSIVNILLSHHEFIQITTDRFVITH